MQLIRAFRRSLPSGIEYSNRLDRELFLINKYGFQESFLQVREILDLVPDFRHITRGSAGCSLVAYLLGIHNLDPIENKFVLSRFMHENRPDFPDIDLDFAYNQRDVVLEKVKSKYSGRVARISNHVLYKKRSAIRKALNVLGHKKFISRFVNPFDIVGQENVEHLVTTASQFEGKLKNYSLHCGGIVIFPDKVPNDLKLSDDQIKLNKDEVEKNKLFKIDLLCNRGLAQINDLSNRPLEDYPEFDNQTAEVFKSGKTWGITFGESPAQRRLYADIKPSNRSDISFCLALIRPLPSADGRRKEILDSIHQFKDHRGHIVYDDDGIIEIQKILNCSESEAELYRKSFSKNKKSGIEEFKKRISNHPDKEQIIKQLHYFSLYSFCKAHAYSYGNLVWALAYEKTRQPKKFWWSTLNHAQSMYRPWVHVQEAKLAGLQFRGFGKGPWKLDGDFLLPSHQEPTGDGWSQFDRRGYWISNRFMPGMYSETNGSSIKFRGLIATGRHHTVNDRDITFVTVGVGSGKYIDVILDGLYEFDMHDVLCGEGVLKNNSISCTNFKFEFVNQKPKQLLLFSN